jgi:type IX secretion system PorP/SprF family membrane protein
MKQALLLLLLGLASKPLFAQQEAMLSNYFFNKLAFNPACAGSNDHLTASLTYRQQWRGFEDAPVTQVLGVHSPIGGNRVALGFSLIKDKAGATETYEIYPSYAYWVPVGRNMKLSFGLQAGLSSWHADWFDVNLEHQSDDIFDTNITTWKPNFGAGVYLHSERFYAGLSCPRILEQRLVGPGDTDVPSYAQYYRHYFAMAGAAIPIYDKQMVFRPSILVKTTGFLSRYHTQSDKQPIGAPTAVDISAALFIQETFWAGISYRTALQLPQSSDESADVFFAWHLRNGIRIGASYDILLSKIRHFSAGSFEIMAGYEFDIKVRRVYSPRYF